MSRFHPSFVLVLIHEMLYNVRIKNCVHWTARWVRDVGKVIAVANQKGGVGKTTTSVNLSACMAEAGRRVLLVDIDPQGNATSGLGRAHEEGRTVYDVLIGECSAKEAILSTGFGPLDLMPTAIALAGAEIELVDVEERENLLKKALTDVREQYDYIFVDCPPSLSLLTLNALTAADTILIPIQCEYYALEGVGQLMNTVKLMRRKLNPDLSIEGILLTMFDARTNLCAQVVQEVRAHFPDEVFETMIPRNIRLSEAPSFGMPINFYEPNGKGCEAYMELAREFLANNER